METLTDRLADLTAEAPNLGFALTLAGRSLLLFALAGGALLLLRRAAAARRHLVLLFALAGLLLLPLLPRLLPPAAKVADLPVLPAPPPSAPLKPAQTALPPASPPHDRAVTETAPRTNPAAAAVAAPVAEAPPAVAAAPSLLTRLDLLAVWLYAAGVALLLLSEAAGRRRLGRLARAAAPVAEGALHDAMIGAARALGVRRPVHLMLCPDALPPLTFGTRRPVLLLPEEARGWTPERLRAVLLHEMAHIARCDALSQAFARLVCALWWWHPLAWGLARALRAESERACDDRVLLSGVTGPEYAAHLVDLVRALRPGSAAAAPRHAVAMAQQHGRKKLGGRVQAILDARRARHGCTRRGALLGGLIAAVLLVPAAVLRLTPRGAPPSGPEKRVPAADPLPDGFGRATLPNGATVEVVAIGFRGKGGWERFGRHGDRIAPHRSGDPGRYRGDDSGPTHSFEVRLLGVDRVPLGVAWRSKSPAVESIDLNSFGHSMTGDVLSEVTARGVARIPGGTSPPSAVDIEYGVALERRRALELPVLPKPDTGDHPAAWRAKDSTPTSTWICVDLPQALLHVPTQAYALVAVDGAGREHIPLQSYPLPAVDGAESADTRPHGFGENWTTLFLSFNELKSEDVVAVRLLTSPYTWVTLKDVPLRPEAIRPVIGPVSPIVPALPGHAVALPDGTTVTLEDVTQLTETPRVPELRISEFRFTFRVNGGRHERYRWVGTSLRAPRARFSAGPSERQGGKTGRAEGRGPLLTFTAEVYPDDLHSPSPMDVTPVRVRLGLTDDRWKTVASTRVRIAGNGRIRSQVGDFSVRTDPSNPQWLDAAPHSAAYGRQYRLVAVDARGREHVIRGAEGAVWQDAVTGGYGTVLPARHTIREVRLQTAPVYWVEFRDIYLRSDYPAQTAARGGSEGEAPWDGAGKRLVP